MYWTRLWCKKPKWNSWTCQCEYYDEQICSSHHRTKERKHEEALIKEANKIKEKLATKKITFKVKTGAGDKVFGSISTKQIADELKKNGFEIDKKQINLDIPIASLGFFDVEINLHKKVKATIKVEVVKWKK